MARYDYDMAVIGGGAAGLTVAAGSARIGAKTLIIEKEPRLGGDCLHYGCVPSKTLINIARVRHLMARASIYGLPGADLAPVKFSRVSEKIRHVIDEIQKHDSVERFCSLGAKVEFGEPLFVDEHTVDLNGKRISAEKWTIATGSSPSAPPFKGLEEAGYWTNKDIFYLDDLPSSMIILGAGPIAVEMAQAFNRLGTKVTIIQRSGQILSKEDKDLADMVMERLVEEGVSVRLNCQVESVAKGPSGQKQVVVTRKDNGQETIEAHDLLVAMGRRPNIGRLRLENAGVEFSKKGVVVDSRLRTSQKHIYAAGDVTGKYLFTHAAGYEGGIVVTNAIFHFPRKANYSLMPWCTYCDPELASIGMNEKMAKKAGVEYQVWSEDFSSNDRAVASLESTGRAKLILDRRGRPIGCQILGPHAGELLAYWVAALNGGTSLTTLAGAVLPYPTLSEINKRVAADIVGERIFSERLKKGLKFFFGFKGRACGVKES